MVFGFLKKARGGPVAADHEAFAPVEVPGRVYAIGDIHGCAHLLDRLLGRISAECVAADEEAEVVFMGDYVDRGDDSREVLSLLRSAGEREGIRPVWLRGNHEELLLEFLDGFDEEGRWIKFGGLQTLLSYRVRGVRPVNEPGEIDRLRDELARALGDDAAFLRDLPASHSRGNVFFAHAGADPRRALDDQPGDALIWGSRGFLSTPRRDGNWVVHGHYVVDEPVAAAGRIAVDTGAYFSQRLTAVCLGEGTPRFLSAGPDD